MPLFISGALALRQLLLRVFTAFALNLNLSYTRLRLCLVKHSDSEIFIMLDEKAGPRIRIGSKGGLAKLQKTPLSHSNALHVLKFVISSIFSTRKTRESQQSCIRFYRNWNLAPKERDKVLVHVI